MWLCFTNNVYIFCFPHTKTLSDFQRKANPPSPKSLAKRFCRLVWSKNISPWSCCGQVGMDWTICWVGVFPTASSMDGSLTLWSSKAHVVFQAAEGHKQEQGWLRISCWCKRTVLEMLFKSMWLQSDQNWTFEASTNIEICLFISAISTFFLNINSVDTDTLDFIQASCRTMNANISLSASRVNFCSTNPGWQPQVADGEQCCKPTDLFLKSSTASARRGRHG